MTPQTPPWTHDGRVKFSVSREGGHKIDECDKIQARTPNPNPRTPPPESQPLPRKRAAAKSIKGQPKSKKPKFQHPVYDDEEDFDDAVVDDAIVDDSASDDDDGDDDESQDVVSPEVQQSIRLRKNLTANKPEPFGQPPMFARTRGGLCDTVHQFKSNQGSGYRNKSRGGLSMYFGFLCDGGVYERDYFSDQVIICTIGGGREKDANGKMVLAKDHKEDHQFAMAAMNAMKNNQAVIACVGQSNTKFPVKLSHYYIVLGWFHITDVWFDKYEKSCWVFRAEAINLITRPHWSVKAAPFVASSPSAPRAPIMKCATCKKTTKEIYTVGWFCMTPKCKSYFQQSGQVVPLENLQYSEVFLQERTQFQGQVPSEIAPVFPKNLISGPATKDLNAEIKQGFVCPVCNCCSRRIRWNSFNCENPGCGVEYNIPRRVLTVSESCKKPNQAMIKGFFNGGVTRITVPIGGYEVDIYGIPDAEGNLNDCYTFHFKSNKIVNSKPFGPDDIFSTLQREDLNLKRCPVRTAGHVVEMVTNHFTKNYGATYKFFVPQESDGFDVAPDVMLRILMRNTWAAKTAMEYLGADYIAPNELLSLGYQKSNQINYHNDGEDTLGPTVTSLSLGGGAVMKWRRKKVLAGKGKNKQEPRKASKDILQIYLQHGDFMVMTGGEFQKYIEHCVIPDGELRFASTARTILCERIADPAEREHAIKAGIIPARATKFLYNGDAVLSTSGSAAS
ncbi:hypothetical protein IFR05_012017 [Cadophora sp. M221]|nr:hypothetical protein IFR05_012017 [Cadophora sp. M221]